MDCLRAGGLSALVLLAASPLAQAVDIGVTGSWLETIDRNDLSAGAGSDVRTPIESSSVTLDITNTLGAGWTVQLSRSDINWPAGVALAARRTSDGIGGGSISGGAAYVAANGAPQFFFTGTGDRTGIQIQLRTEGVSVRTAPGTYSTGLIYSIY
ncbi:hypothetical protein [Aromatoleum petrolei]|uniref:Uncharacterized protein n=1 Tax=Aromatoleum petrolei TaxID=76116 RepID=A0ABX1MJJ6_9RHOO|nr:hypothetical protein [Aromatoleum petrolei]NMF88129.1 hypothetical protein [Aromatoleum petrolei]QTQ38919.1 Uncharacterized protein ToN1_48250 [Aromatoleum petrolei]